YILKKIQSGITEKELAFELEMFVRKHGAVPSFNTIAAFGAHASIPHHASGQTKLLENGEFVLLDFGTKIDNYCSDMTRTVFWGKSTLKQKKIYQTVFEAQSKAAEFLDSQI